MTIMVLKHELRRSIDFFSLGEIFETDGRWDYDFEHLLHIDTPYFAIVAWVYSILPKVDFS